MRYMETENRLVTFALNCRRYSRCLTIDYGKRSLTVKIFELGIAVIISQSKSKSQEMLNIDPVYKPAKIGEARDTLCNSIFG